MEQKLRLAVDHLMEGVQVIDTTWRYVYINETAAAHGQRRREELIGRTMMECYPGIQYTELFHKLTDVMERRAAARLRNEFTYPSGDRRWFDLRIEPVPDGICVLSLDVTESLRLEMELHHAQRMDAVGKLAGGIAHDFNNQLTAIQGFVQLLLEGDHEETVRQDLQAISDAADRSAALTRQLLAFGRRQALRIEPTDINDVVTSVHRLLQRLIGADIECQVHLHPAPAIILGDARQLENVLTNLAVNARDAMPTGGRLSISTAVVELSDEDASQHATMTSGRYAVLSVADTGHGMDEATKAHIFEPFFTTKGAGRGTGLGLATAYGVVKQMGGFIWVYSEVGQGTMFRLYFPTASVPTLAAPPAPAGQGRGDATVLVVEDDAGVRGLIVRTLKRAGYQTLAAATAQDAQRLARELVTPPDLVLADVVLPGGGGPELVDRIAGARTRVLYMSGYSEGYFEERGWKGRVLEKPFTASDLLQAIEQTLAGG